MKLIKNICSEEFFKDQNEPLYFALSSGVDSIATLHWLKNTFRFDRKRPLKAIHFNHRLRPQNDVMEAKSRHFCEKNGIDLLVHVRNEDSGKNTEKSLREFRINFYIENHMKVVTAHHLDDAVENYLFNVMKGTPEFMPITLHTYLSEDSTVFHPFIKNTKDELINYVKENDLEEFVEEDETNSDEKMMRNSVRHSIVPVMNKWTNLRTIVRKKFYENIDKFGVRK